MELAYMTGILPIKKYGEHSAINIFDEYSVTDPKNLGEYFGFTETEVRKQCEKYNADFDKMRKWYDGYQMGSIHIYNPKSVVDALTWNKFKSYWTGTEPISTTGKCFFWNKTTFEKAGLDTPKTIEDLINAGTVFKEKLGDDSYPLAMSEYHSGCTHVKILGKLFSIPCGRIFYSPILKIRQGNFIPHPIVHKKTENIRWL